MSFSYIPLSNRHVLTLEGEDAAHFLQGLITNDIKKVTDTNAIYACILTPQGKYLYDFFISQWQGKYFLDAGTTNPEGLLRKLKMYKLRSKVDINLASEEYTVVALTGDDILSHLSLGNVAGTSLSDTDAVYYTDPRNPRLGARAIVKSTKLNAWWSNKHLEQGTESTYEHLRFTLGIPDGVRDLMPEDSFPLPFGMEILNAIDFKKGCYVGQEVTTRSKHRGSIKKGLYRITADTALPAYGTPIMAGTSKVGEVLSSYGNIGLALIRNEDWEKAQANSATLTSGDIQVTLLDN